MIERECLIYILEHQAVLEAALRVQRALEERRGKRRIGAHRRRERERRGRGGRRAQQLVARARLLREAEIRGESDEQLHARVAIALIVRALRERRLSERPRQECGDRRRVIRLLRRRRGYFVLWTS